MDILFHTGARGETGYAAHANEFWNKRLKKFTDGKGYPFNIILDTVGAAIFFNEYEGIKIAYNVWETTEYPAPFFEHLKRNYDMLWVPSEWQASCAKAQGFPPNKLHVVPEGVDPLIFKPTESQFPEKFRFMIFGKWESRKATQKLVECFRNAFPGYDDSVELLLAADNPFDPEPIEAKLQRLNLEDDRIRVCHFLPREEYIKTLQAGHVFLSCSLSEGWNLPLIEAMASGIPSIYSNCSGQREFTRGHGLPIIIKKEIEPFDVFGVKDCPGKWFEPDWDMLVDTMKEVRNNYDHYREQAVWDSERIRNDYSWDKAVETALEILKKYGLKLKKGKPSPLKVKTPPLNITCNFMNGAVLDIKGGSKLTEYTAHFKDKANLKGVEEFRSVVKRNQYSRTNRVYFTDWEIKVKENATGKIVFEHEYNARKKNVIVWLASTSLGDTIAWFPYAAEFQKKHDCNMHFSSHHNFLFKGHPEYKHIKFIKPGGIVDSVYARYSIGVFFREPHKQPRDWRAIPLQQVAADILGLEYQEIAPKINTQFAYARQVKRPKKYVCISEHSTAQCKYWNREGGWQELVDYLKGRGYDVVAISYEPTKLQGVIDATNNHIDVTIGLLLNCEMYIGLASGLSWLAWSLGKEVTMISGFSLPYCEFIERNHRVEGVGDCVGCVNDPLVQFNRGDWAWCPHQKEYQCTKLIEPEMVIKKIEEAL